jgi:hypothetical protein
MMSIAVAATLISLILFATGVPLGAVLQVDAIE